MAASTAMFGAVIVVDRPNLGSDPVFRRAEAARRALLARSQAARAVGCRRRWRWSASPLTMRA